MFSTTPRTLPSTVARATIATTSKASVRLALINALGTKVFSDPFVTASSPNFVKLPDTSPATQTELHADLRCKFV